VSANPTVVSWCPGAVCDPCSCFWGVNIVDPATLCVAPTVGIGATADSPGDRGDIVLGHVDIGLHGIWYGPAAPTAIPSPIDGKISVQLNGVELFNLNPNDGDILNFSAGPGPDGTGCFSWFATARMTLPCIMMGDGDFAVEFGYDCVYAWPGQVVSTDPATGSLIWLDLEIVQPPDQYYPTTTPPPPGGIWSFPHVPGATFGFITLPWGEFTYSDSVTGVNVIFPYGWGINEEGYAEYMTFFPADFRTGRYNKIDSIPETSTTYSYLTWSGGALPGPAFFIPDTDPIDVTNSVSVDLLDIALYRSH
jgi:hypothetical protein